MSGWGAACEGEEAHGFWSSTEQNMHINFLEILAVFLALKSFAANDSNCQILLRIDNTTAIAHLNKMGGVKFPNLNDITKEVWEWSIQREIWIFAEYVPSKKNIADKYSRLTNIDTEWEIAAFAHQKIVQRFGTPEVNLFATRNNTKCEAYCS